MPRKGKIAKDLKYYPKWRVRKKNRCPICGRPRGFMRYFNMCRLCFRERALRGELPGVRKSSW
ncbi:MAG TPA: type Z 30S ribosomal protein S14 [Aquificaceae bacterium]|nr:type Z 30S ribosomal protein S14 [Aquificaceae bacterium]HIQ31713.1 type Z 30S ribosomal protein S14 [Aquifex aeolicus]